jgi:hypothetical protein
LADPVSIAINVALVAASMAITASQEFEGPRQGDLKITTADYGTPMNYVWGRRRLDGVSCIWAEPLSEVKRRRKTKGGKFNDYTYYGTWAVALCDHEIASVLKIWFDRNLVYDATGVGPISPLSLADFGDRPAGEAVSQLGLGDISQFMTIYLGTADQEPDPRMAATVDAEFGEDSTPAYRGVAYIVFKDLPLEKLGNRLPQVSVEVATAAEDAFPYEMRDAAVTPAMFGSYGVTWSPDRTRLYTGEGGPFEIWDVRARALMVSGDFDTSEGAFRAAQHTWGVTLDGSIYALVGNLSGMRLARYEPDGLGAPIIMGKTELDPGDFGRGSYCVALQTATGSEYVCIASYSNENGGYMLPHGAITVKPAYQDPFIATGFDWQIKAYFADAYGDIWAVGGGGDLADNILALWRVVHVSGNGGPAYGFVTMPTNQSGIVAAAAFHHLSATADHFVVFWDASGGNRMAIVDRLTMTLGTVLTTGVGEVVRAIAPGAATFWSGATEIDASDLSIIRSLDFDDWTATQSGAPNTYDALNHAFVVAINDDEIAWLYIDRAAGSGVTLRSIVEDVSERAGLTVAGGDIDATDLTQTVQGYSATQGTGKQWLEALLEAYDSEVRPHDFTLQFLRRGVAVGGAIPVSDMGAGGTTRYEAPTLGDSDLPLKVNLTFADVDRDQQPNTALAQRPQAAADSRRELSLDGSTLALDADDALQMADGYLRRQWTKAQTYKLALTRSYTSLEPGDARTLDLDGVDRVAKLVRLEFGANGVLTTEWERYAVAVHTPTTRSGGPADGLIPGEVPVFGYTKGLALDIPLVSDAHDSSTPLVYLAATPYSDDVSWPGATFYRSDDGIDYEEELGEVATSQAATSGYAMSALPDALSTVWDMANSVSIKMFDGELASATQAEVANGTNWALLGDEIIGYTTATLVATDTYQLSGLLRGRRGTERATGDHASGERFVLLSGLPRAGLGASDVGDVIYVRPTTNGGPNGFPQTLNPFSGAALKPYSPAHLEVANSGGDKVITWVRRTRIGGEALFGTTPPLGETTEAYVVQILDVSGSVIRTYNPTTPTATYTAAQIASDGSPAGVTARVMQVSSVVGNGYPADVAL